VVHIGSWGLFLIAQAYREDTTSITDSGVYTKMDRLAILDNCLDGGTNAKCGNGNTRANIFGHI